MTTEVIVRIVVDVPEETVDLLERLVVVLENEYEKKYGDEEEWGVGDEILAREVVRDDED